MDEAGRLGEVLGLLEKEAVFAASATALMAEERNSNSSPARLAWSADANGDHRAEAPMMVVPPAVP